jgi:hypothetical protein
MKFIFEMSDAWGDDYVVTIDALTEKEATKIATLIDDDAVPKRLIGIQE